MSKRSEVAATNRVQSEYERKLREAIVAAITSKVDDAKAKRTA